MDFPDPEEEFELMHAEELEMMREMEEDIDPVPNVPSAKSKRSLDFSSPNHTSEPPEVSQPPSVSSAAERKRKVEELFGDISDIYLDDTKKRKEATLESDADLIERIKAQRQIQKQTQKVLDNFQCVDANKSCTGVTWRVPAYPFVPVTLSNGERIYARLRSEQYMEQQIGNISAQSRMVGLLSTPYQNVWEQAQEYILKRTDVAKDTDSGCEMVSEDDSDTADLWVEKYKPKKYVELLSDEGANRTLLHWLKLWDKVVFNRERKVKQKVKEDGKKEKKFQKAFVNTDLDEHGCPQQKVALLCGHPGLGKTTLAHMVGIHAGYNVVEMNASDDRSPEVFRTQLEAATQMKAVIGMSPRPNCLVLDEIDGAPIQSIDVLIKFVTGKQMKGKKKGQTGGGGGNVLKRPVICICNDIYVPALRALRQIALIVHFPPTASSRLAQRLMEIARKQKIRTDMGALLALAEKSSNDIRSCLSVLHFFKSQKKDVRLVDIQRNNIGQKDVQKGLFTVWQEIFQIQHPKRKMCQINKDGQMEPMSDLKSSQTQFGDTSLGSRMHNILHSVQCCGDYDRLVQGVYENFLNLAYRDSRLHAVCSGLEWFCTSDVFSHKIKTTQNYVLLPYQPYAFVMWHFLFASFSWPKVSYPSAGYEVMVKEQRCKQILKELMEGMSPLVRVHSNPAQLLFDTLSPLLQILVPSLRPVNTQLYSAREIEELNHVVSVMIDYNLNYLQERNQEGGYVYRFDPNVEEITFFPGYKPTRTLSYAGKQLISREVELEKMRRAEKHISAPASNSKAAVPTTSAPKTPAVPDQKLKPKPINEMQCKDFFGRVIQPKPGSSNALNKARTDEIVKSSIWYHYKEGYSNAVRRSVKMSELLDPKA